MGRHNAINVCGALTAVRTAGVDLTDRRIQAGLDSFRPLDYRLQNLGMLEGRLVIDDGLSTAPEAAIAAISAYPDRPIGLIVGGHDRGLDYSELAAAIAARTQPTWVFGVPDNGPRIIACIREHQARPDGLPSSERAHLETFEDFDDAIRAAAHDTPSGGVLMLSPAAPSFGRFRDYKDRSARFRALLGLT